LNKVHVGIIEMDNVFVAISQLRHAHGALLAKAHSVAESSSIKDYLLGSVFYFELGRTKL
jgi:hypothetical protein